MLILELNPVTITLETKLPHYTMSEELPNSKKNTIFIILKGAE